MAILHFCNPLLTVFFLTFSLSDDVNWNYYLLQQTTQPLAAFFDSAKGKTTECALLSASGYFFLLFR